MVSVIIPLYNRADLIGETLDSLRAQTWEHWECIVVDDHSTDKSVEAVEAYSRQDERIKIVRRPSALSKGANACRNYGLQISQGAYVCFLDSDDLFTPNKLEIQLDQFEKSTKEKVACISQAKCFVKEPNNTIRYWKDSLNGSPLTLNLIKKKAGWQTAAPLWKRSVLEGKPFDETLQAGQDFHFHILQSLKFSEDQFLFDDRVMVLVRSDNSSIIRSDRKQKRYYLCLSRLALYRDIKSQYPKEKEARALLQKDLNERISNMAQERNRRLPSILFDYLKARGDFSFFQKVKYLSMTAIVMLFKRGRRYLVTFD